MRNIFLLSLLVVSLELIGAESSSSSSSSSLGKRKSACATLFIKGKNFFDDKDALGKIALQLNKQDELEADKRKIVKDRPRIRVTIDGDEYFIWMVSSSLGCPTTFAEQVREQDKPMASSERCKAYFVTQDGNVSEGWDQSETSSSGWFARFLSRDIYNQLSAKRQKTN